jgi:phosphate:Na+ symporter
MKVVFDILMLAGSLGLFLFGMKMMSEALQKVAGDKMRSILGAMTSNPLKRVLTGVLVTAVIQSSSATTVMIVSFVNAGLLTLTQSIGVIMGANIGTTVTAWIISLLGFKMDMAIVAIPLIAIGFPLLMFKSSRNKSWGEFIIGFALLFIGLAALKNAVPDISQNQQVMEFLKDYAHSGFGSVLVFVLIGTLLTVVLQSSSATMALTLVMCSQGLPFEIAVGMVMGENIGTTITANIAAAVANTQAKRAARAHFLFNVIGVLWVLILFHPFLKLTVWTMGLFGGSSPYSSVESVTVGLALFHTGFNIINTCFLIGFTPWIVKAVTWMVKQKKTEDGGFRLKYIQRGMLSTAELSLTQAKMEIVWYAKRTTKQFDLVRDLFKEVNAEKFDALFKKIEHDEEISDRIELEIATYLNKIGEDDLSEESSRRLQAMYKAISEVESVSDSNYNLARVMMRKKNLGVWFDQELRDKVNEMFDLLDKAYTNMNENLEKGYDNIVDIGNAYECENAINEFRSLLKEEHIRNLEENKYKYIAGVIYMDLIIECEKLGDYIVNVSESVLELKHGF